MQCGFMLSPRLAHFAGDTQYIVVSAEKAIGSEMICGDPADPSVGGTVSAVTSGVIKSAGHKSAALPLPRKLSAGCRDRLIGGQTVL